jgi:hypothetical protein
MKRIAINEWAKPAELIPRLRGREFEDCEILDISRNLLGPEGMRGLINLRFPKLVALELFANRIGDRGARFLGAAHFAGQLTRLGLGGESRFGMDNDIGDEGFVALLPNLTSIADLDLGYNRAGSAAASALGRCTALKHLRMSANRLGNEGARALALAGTKWRLDSLDVSDNQITVEGIAELARAEWLQSLQRVVLTRNRFGDEGAKCLAASTMRPRSLELNECAMGDAGAAALAASPVLSCVETLGLGDNRIGEEGLAALINSPFLGNVRTLYFRNNPAGPSYSPWQDWDGSETGYDFDHAHADRIAAMFGRTIDVR